MVTGLDRVPGGLQRGSLTDVFLHNASSGQWFKLLNDGTGYTTESSGYWWPGWQKFVLELEWRRALGSVPLRPGDGPVVQGPVDPGGFTYATGYWTPGWEITPDESERGRVRRPLPD